MLISFRFICILLSVVWMLNPVYGQDTDSAEILIEGADGPLTTNIRSYLRVGTESCDTPLSRLNRLRTQVNTNVRQASNALGYYQSVFSLNFTEEEDCWQLTVTITPGERVVVKDVSVHVSGSTDDIELFEEVLSGLPDFLGEPLNHQEYESIKNALSAKAVENGYFSAGFRQAAIRLDLTAYAAEFIIEFEPGPRYTFGQISIEPVAGLSETFINSMVILQAGEPYSSERLLDQRNNFDKSRYFRQITVSPQLSRVNQQTVPIVIQLSPLPRQAWSSGLGFTTDTGPRIRGDYENRYFNSSGYQIRGDAAFSAVRSQMNIAYVIPLADPVNESVSFGTGYITEKTDAFESDRFKMESAYRRLSSFGWLESYSVNFLRDDFKVDLQQDVSTITMLGYSLSKTSADNLINPTRGWKLFGQLRGAHEAFISDASFIQFYGSGKSVFSAGPGRFITKLEVGATLIDQAENLPASVRFFAGGDQSLRGYKYRTLGPLNINNEVVGGEHLLTGSMEYDFPVKNNWRAALFVDGGNAFSDAMFAVKKSVGFGVRWLSPIGPIRADLARALDDEGGFRLHITMGPDL